MIWFTADTHFNHKNIIKFCNRPFSNVEEMNSSLIINWNSKVRMEDTIYHLGDFGFGEVKPILGKLNGKIVLMRGSHEKSALQYRNWFKEIHSLLEIRQHDPSIILCHYAMRVWSKSHYNSWHLYGHSHGRLSPIGKSWDVGVDNNNFFPLSLTDIERIMKTRPDNFNLIKER